MALNKETKEAKAKLRKQYLKNRLELSEKERRECADKAYKEFFSNVTLKEKSVIAGYWPIKGELNVLPILKQLLRLGHVCVLPHVIGKEEPMVFKKWYENMPMIKGHFDIEEPAVDERSVPDVILLPLVAFDKNNYRIGYGAGLYDRTIAALKAVQNNVFTIGMAYQQQLCENIPVEETDMIMDMVVTEKNVYI